MAAETKESILAILQENEEEIRALGVRRLGLFGSFARGEQDEDSDVHVLVDFTRQKGVRQLHRLGLSPGGTVAEAR